MEENVDQNKEVVKGKNAVVVYLLVGLIAAGVIFYLAANVIPRALITLTKAAPSNKISIGNSYILGDKLLCRADGVDKCKVNVFVLDAEGKGVSKKSVELEGVTDYSPKTGTTDNNGMVSFELLSAVEGQKKVSASVGGVSLGKEVTVTFRN